MITLNDPHAPHQNAKDAFNHILPTIKAEIVKSRHNWDKHEPKMWSRAAGLSDHELTSFKIDEDLVLVNGMRDLIYDALLTHIRSEALQCRTVPLFWAS